MNGDEEKGRGTATLTGLFEPPPPPARRSISESTPLLSNVENKQNGEDQEDDEDESPRQRRDLFKMLKDVPTVRFDNTAVGKTSPRKPRSIYERFVPLFVQRLLTRLCLLEPTTYAGSIMFLLYHVVFCLANGSAIIRPNNTDGASILGVMTKSSAVGILCAGPFYVLRLGKEIPALYPSIDLFLAPFLARAAALVDDSLTEQHGTGKYPDQEFFGSFAALVSIGMCLAGLFLLLAATFKLANLGTFLPFSVLCGFFSAVGVLMWALAFSVDTGGKTWQDVFFSGNPELILESVLHHLPSLIVGILMNRLGPKNPFLVILLIVVTLICFYATMLITGTSLTQAQELGWFWSFDELVYESDDPSPLLPPSPFGSFGAWFQGYVNWKAVRVGLPNMAALAFLYLLRSSIHATAMRKNVGNLVMRIPIQKKTRPELNKSRFSFKSMRDSVRIVNMSLEDRQELRKRVSARASDFMSSERPNEGASLPYKEIRAKPTRMPLEKIFVEYGYSLLVVSVCGGFGCCPTVATSNTMYAIGADKAAPQIGSILLLIIFYFTDFEFVRFIPKTAFSSLLVLGAVDTLVVWFIGAFWKTQDVAEWLVVPFIVLFSLFVGFLNAVFLGIGISTFLFVASFFRVGVVKFNSTGLAVRSRVERSMTQCEFLSLHGDSIQILVLQNYLFFGNASNILNYISTMFEEVEQSESETLDFSLPPKPQMLIVDLTLITGMDTSTADIFGEIKELCADNSCKLFLCGLSTRIRNGLKLGGVVADRGPRSKRIVYIVSDLDTALGKSEDLLIENEMTDNYQPRSGKGGLPYALKLIDELHGQEFANSLLGLERFTTQVDLEPGQFLYKCNGGQIKDSDRGLFFVEMGLLRRERDPSLSVSMSTLSRNNRLPSTNDFTVSGQHARLGTLAKKNALRKGVSFRGGTGNIRLARYGPGWIVGMNENATHVRGIGVTVAVTKCRLHHLPFHRLDEIEKQDPILALRLYKLLSYLMAHREETMADQLSTLHSIMSSPAHSRPISRLALRNMS